MANIELLCFIQQTISSFLQMQDFKHAKHIVLHEKGC